MDKLNKVCILEEENLMAVKDYKAVEIFSAKLKNEIDEKDIELQEAREAVRLLAQEYVETHDPGIRTEIAQMTAYTVDEALRERTNYIDLIADRKDVDYGEKAIFITELDGLTADITAKGVAPERSTNKRKTETVDTKFVSTRPYIGFMDLATGRINFDRMAEQAADKIDNAIVKELEEVLYNSFSTFASPNYGKGTGVEPSVLDDQIDAFMRLGGVTLVGDVQAIGKITSIDGFDRVPDEMIMDFNKNRHFGIYRGANVVQLINPLVRGSLTDTMLRRDLIYIIPTGSPEMRPLKVLFEGDMVMRERENFEDGSYEMVLGKHFGAKVVGAEHYLGIYEIE